jgi:hypothetical protein
VIREYLRTFTVASLTLIVLAIPSANSYTKIQHPPDDGIRCAYFNNQTGAWQFYMPGDKIVVIDAHGNPVYLYCGQDGNWTLWKSDQGTSDHGNTGTTHQMP